MKKYCELTAKRRDVIDHIVANYPETKTTGTVTFKQIRTLWPNGKGTTNSEGAALGYPLWLTVESEFRTDVRGDYAIPLDDGTPIPTKSAKVKAETAKKETTKKVKTEKPVVPKLKRKIDDSEKVELSDDEFVAELAAAGITL
jgi:hypothetical protein